MEPYRISKFTGYNDLTQTSDGALLQPYECPVAQNMDFTREFGSVTKDWGEKKIGDDSVIYPLNGEITLIKEGDVFDTTQQNKRMVVAGTTLYLYCTGGNFVPIDTPFTAGQQIDFCSYNNTFYFSDGVGNIQTWDGYSFGTNDMVFKDETLFVDDDCSSDGTADWAVDGTGAVAFDTDHYEFSSSAIDDSLYHATSIADLAPYYTKYIISLKVKDGTQSSGTIKVGTLDSTLSEISTEEITTTSAWATHEIEIDMSSTDTYVGMFASADWSGANIEIKDIEVTPVWNWKAKRIAIYKNRLLIADTTEAGTNYPSRIRYSDHGDPTVWAYGDAIDLTTNSGEKVVRMVPLYDNLISFKENSIHLITYVGESTGLSYSTTILDERVTNIAPWSIAKTPSGLTFLSEEGMFTCDGQSVQPMTESIKIDGIIKSIYIDSLSSCYGASSDILHQYWLSLPLRGNSTCNYIVVFDWKYSTWKVLKKDTTCLGFFTSETTGTWDAISDLTWEDIANLSWDSSELYGGSKFAVFGDSSGYVRKRFPGFNNDAVGYEAFFETPWLDFGAPYLHKDYVKIAPIWEGTDGANVTVEYKTDYGENWETCIDEDLKVYRTSPLIDLQGNGTHIKFRFSNSVANESFTVHGATIFYEKRGIR